MSRDTSFLIFSAWLITSLRVLAMNSGWGYAWIEEWLPQHLIAPTLTATLALHAFLTVSLFGRLYEGDQRFQRTSLVLRYLSYTCLSLGAVAYFLPKNLVHPALLVTCGAGMICLVLQVVRHANAKRDLSSFLYVVAWVTMLAGLAGEIVSVSTMFALFPRILNAETGTLACGAMLALALAQRLKEEATSRELAQVLASQADARSAKNYAAMPIGLFGVEADGTLRVFNPAFAELFQSIAGKPALLHSSRLDEILGKDANLLWDERLSDSNPYLRRAGRVRSRHLGTRNG
jgi:hypothetical protein